MNRDDEKKKCYAHSETMGCRLENFGGKCECPDQPAQKPEPQTENVAWDEEAATGAAYDVAWKTAEISFGKKRYQPSNFDKALGANMARWQHERTAAVYDIKIDELERLLAEEEHENLTLATKFDLIIGECDELRAKVKELEASCKKGRQIHDELIAANRSLESKLEAAREWSKSAFEVLNHGAELMPLDELGQWTGVRAVIETYPDEIDSSEGEKNGN